MSLMHQTALSWRHRMAITGDQADDVMHGQSFGQIWVDPNDIDTALMAGSLKQEDYRSNMLI